MDSPIDIEDDLLFDAKERKTAGKILSECYRLAIQSGDAGSSALENGIPVLASRGEVVTTEHIQRIMEEEGI